jgi:membrane-bound lytic murein transglycosylase B
MTARVGLALLIAALAGLAGWLAVGPLTTAADARPSVLEPAPAPVGDSDRPPAGAASAPVDAAVVPERPATSALLAVSRDWAAAAASATGIPERALVGYAGAALALQREQPSCGLGWNTLAALGWIESGHGTHDGATIGPNGVATPAITGPALDGADYDDISDTDGGAYDGDPRWDRAVGPLQFIPSTWREWGSDGSGDGTADPQQIDDAALAAARYLCHYGALTEPSTWRTAVFAYNHVETYVDSVAVTADQYATDAATVPVGAWSDG